ncbi:GroES-like protein [Lipomyces doorenjongii]
MPSFTVFNVQESGIAKKSTISKPEQLVGDSVLVKVTTSGICGTDLHYLKLVLGHEGVGVVERVCVVVAGALYRVKKSRPSSFASDAIWRESFLYKIPDGFSDVDAAPLQCGGATTFSGLYNVQPNDTGGTLGVRRLAIQFAVKVGCRVVMLSGSDSKSAEAMRLAARIYCNKWRFGAQGLLAIEPAVGQLSALCVGGNLERPYMALLLQGISARIASCPTYQHRQMLDFAGLHKIKPIVEMFPMTEEGIKPAIDKLTRNEVYCRAVLIPE